MKKVGVLVIGLLTCASCAYYNPKPWTQEEKVALGWSCLASAADMYTTTRFLDNEENWEINPILGKHPSDTEVYLVLGLSQVLTVVTAHCFPDLRVPLICGKAAVNTAFAMHNTTLER